MTPRRRADTVAQSERQWRVWAEQRLISADAYVERLRVEARQAAEVAAEYRCLGCEVAIFVPRNGDRLEFHRAYAVHELGCPRA